MSTESTSLLTTVDLPVAFERWRVVIEPRAERVTDRREWEDALVMVESGVVECICESGVRQTFVAGDLVALCWLEVARLRNPADEPARLVAIRRRRRGASSMPNVSGSGPKTGTIERS